MGCQHSQPRENAIDQHNRPSILFRGRFRRRQAPRTGSNKTTYNFFTCSTDRRTEIHESRLRIYALLTRGEPGENLYGPESIRVWDSNNEIHHPSKIRPQKLSAQMLRTCKTVHREMLPLLYDRTIEAQNIEDVHLGLEIIGKDACQFIREMHINIRTGLRRSLNELYKPTHTAPNELIPDLPSLKKITLSFNTEYDPPAIRPSESEILFKSCVFHKPVVARIIYRIMQRMLHIPNGVQWMVEAHARRFSDIPELSAPLRHAFPNVRWDSYSFVYAETLIQANLELNLVKGRDGDEDHPVPSWRIRDATTQGKDLVTFNRHWRDPEPRWEPLRMLDPKALMYDGLARPYGRDRRFCDMRP